MGPHSIAERAAGIDPERILALSKVQLSWHHKSIPAGALGQSAGEYLKTAPTLGDLQTPLLTLDRSRMAANESAMAAWCAARGISIAPHGKTTMAPQLWQLQLDHGAWGITLANAYQARVAHEFGVRRIMIANSVTDPRAIEWLSLAQGPDFSAVSWVDSFDTVALLDSVISRSGGAPLDVVVELGGAGGRTGARSQAQALEVARAAAASPHLRLVGVGGYEGALAHGADSASIAAVRTYLGAVRDLHQILLEQGLYEPGAEIIVTAGGSAYFDDVADVLAGCAAERTGDSPAVSVVIRSGAYLIHDDGFYREISPFSRDSAVQPFAAAMHAWVRVVSVPEPGLAILDAGKRDLPFDEGLPEPQLIGPVLGGAMAPLTGAAITAVNDQHAFLRFDPATTTVTIGDVIQLGLSHPCTAFDKWKLIPVLADVESDHTVVDLIHTFF